MQDTFQYKGYTIKIHDDENAESPQEWGDENVFLVGFHNEFWVEKAGYSQELCQSIARGGKGDDEEINAEAK